MKRAWQISAKVLGGLVLTAVYAMPQAYTISARPGAINYVEGNAYVDGRPISQKDLKATFLNTNDTLSTDAGKAEVLLTPGVFLRIGDNSQIRMISPSLTNTQIEVSRGEAMIEAAGLLKDNNIQIIDHGASITLEKNGLYRVTGDEPPTAGVIEGKAEVYLGDRKVQIGKGHETVVAEPLKVQKFDTKREDDLYAWSNVRSEYDAAASYQTAKNVSINSYGGYGPGYGLGGYGLGGYGFGGYYGPGWFWDNGFNSWAWLPGAGAYYSPFGWGFYGPGYIGYAPVVVVPVNTGGGGGSGKPIKKPVPVNPKNPPAIGALAAASPFANQAARVQTARSFAAAGGFRTANGGTVPVGRAAGPSAASAGAARSSGYSGGGGISARSSGGGMSSAGGGHAGGASSSGGGSHR